MIKLRGTQEQLRSADRRSVGTVIAVAVGIVLVVNVVVGSLLDRQGTNLGYWLIQQKWHLLADLDEPVDTLILGDSAGNQGLNPRVLDQGIGQRSVNLCTIGNTIVVEDLWMLEEYIGRFGPPKRVILVHVYDVWHRSFEPVLLARIPRAGLAWSQAEVALDDGGLADYLLAKYVRLYADNRSLRALLRRPWNHSTAPYAIDPQGFMPVTEASPLRVRRDVAGHLRFVHRQRFRMSAQNRNALERLGALADHRGFDLFVVNSPINEQLAADRSFQGYLAEVHSALEGVAASHPRMHNVPRTYAFAEHQMQNADHITAATAVIYTRRVAAEIETTGSRVDTEGSGPAGGAEQ